MPQNYNIQQLLDEGKEVFPFKYFGSGTVPANGSLPVEIAITADAHFLCETFTGEFSTLSGVATDDGVNHLSCRLESTGRSKKLFNDFIPLSLFLSPGRTRTTGVAGDPTNQLFYPMDFEFLFLAATTIQLDMKNDSAQANTFNWCFNGWKYKIDPSHPPRV